MSGPVLGPRVTVALPVFNGAETLPAVIESVLGQTFADLELVISDNASTDDTESVARRYERADDRVVYQRHPSNIGPLANFRSAAAAARGTFLRWIGDDDSLEPDYVSRVLRAFDEDERRVLVTTEIVYIDGAGTETVSSEHDPASLMSADPVDRFVAMLRLLMRDFALVDPLYAMMRRRVALLPRTNMLREDEVYAAQLSLAGPWGHVAAPLARRHRTEVATADLVRLFGLPTWHRYVADELQRKALMDLVARWTLTPAQRARARAEVSRMYALRKRRKLHRGVAKVERMAGHRYLLRTSEAR